MAVPGRATLHNLAASSLFAFIAWTVLRYFLGTLTKGQHPWKRNGDPAVKSDANFVFVLWEKFKISLLARFGRSIVPILYPSPSLNFYAVDEYPGSGALSPPPTTTNGVLLSFPHNAFMCVDLFYVYVFQWHWKYSLFRRKGFSCIDHRRLRVPARTTNVTLYTPARIAERGRSQSHVFPHPRILARRMA